MRRFRLSTLMLLIVIAALGIVMVVQQRRAARREAELQARLAEKDAVVNWYKAYDSELKERLATWAQRATEGEDAASLPSKRWETRMRIEMSNELVKASTVSVPAIVQRGIAAGAGRAGRGGGTLRLGGILLCRAPQPAHAEGLSCGRCGGSWPGPRGRGWSWRRSRRAWSGSTSSAWAARPPSGTSTWRRYAASSTGW